MPNGNALVTTAPSEIAERFRGLKTPAVLAELTRVRRKPVAAFEATMITLARRVVALRDEADRQKNTISELVAKTAPALLELCGVGPIIAATVICAWGQPGRIRNDAAFAMLAGTAPIPASSGVTNKHRLNRFGDRKLNSAIHIVAVTRLRSDPRTQSYANRRKAEGKSDRDIRRCLKRYITRELFRTLEQTT